MLWDQFERDRIEAERNERERRDQLLRIQSLFLAEKANSLINNCEYDVANLIALEALPDNIAEPNRPYVREVEDSLRKSSVYTYPIIRSSISRKCIQTNGKIVVTEEEDYKLKIWNIKDGAHIDTIDLSDWLKEYYKDILDAHAIDSYALRNHWLKSISFPKILQNVIYLYTIDSLLSIDLDIRHIKPLLLFKRDTTAHYSHTADVIFSHDTRYYFWLTGESDYRYCVSLYDNITNQEIFGYIANSKSSVAFSPDNKLIAFACHKDIHVYDIENIRTNNSGYLAKYRCYDPLFCTFVDNETILAVRGNKSIELWNFVTKEVETIYTSDTDILDVLYRDDILVFVTSSQQIRVLDTRYKLIIAHLDWNAQVRLLSFSDNGDNIYFRDEKSFRIWDYHICSDGSRILYRHPNIIHCVAYSLDMSYFVSISEDCVIIWDVKQQKIIKSIAIEIQEYIDEAIVSNKYDKIFICGNRLYCIDIVSGNINPIAEEKSCNLCLSSDENYILSSSDNMITIYDIESLNTFKEIILPDDQNLLWGEPIAFHPKETLMVIACQKIVEYDIITLTIWDYEKDTSVTSIEIYDCLEYVADNAVHFSDSGNSVIFNAYERDVYKWYFKTNTLCKLDSQSNERQLANNIIEADGCFVVLREHLSLQQLIDKTRESLGVRKLTLEERSKYYLN